MFDPSDNETLISLRLLREAAKEKKPIVFWVGAGVSRWLGYSSWEQMARTFHKQFSKFVLNYNSSDGLTKLTNQDYPEVFELCKKSDSKRYYKSMQQELIPKEMTPLFQAFIEAIRDTMRDQPLRILTTNGDEALERSLPNVQALQRSDIAAVIPLLASEKSFIAKLHGSVSSVSSLVFSSSDYEKIVSDEAYVNVIKHVFDQCSVIFLGYGVRDDYVLKTIAKSSQQLVPFPHGPHFFVSSDALKPFEELHRIKYLISRHSDHRSARRVLDYLRQVQGNEKEITHGMTSLPPIPFSRTVYYISDFKPAGTYQTSQTATAKSNDGSEVELTVGLGFTIKELPSTQSIALHDLVVGLVCFDAIAFPLSELAQLHKFLGSDLFWELIRQETIEFVHSRHEPAFIMAANDHLSGSVSVISIKGEDGIDFQNPLEVVRRNIQPIPGKEKEANFLFEELQRKLHLFERAENVNLPDVIRGATLLPHVSRLLGISEGVLPSKTPKWLRFPILRLAHLIHTSIICEEFGFAAAKLPFGGPDLAGAAFGARPSQEWADSCASYVVTGRYGTHLGTLLEREPSFISKLLKFRDTEDGVRLRQEVRQSLDSRNGTEFDASVDAGLRRMIPSQTLQSAKDGFSTLLTESQRQSLTPVLLVNSRNGDEVTRLWRDRSREELLALCQKYGVSRNDSCICGSGEPVKDCCLLALQT